jgi:hypothetical protein
VRATTWFRCTAIGLALGVVRFAYAADQTEIERLLDKTDDVTRGAASTATLSMQVKTAHYERTIRMEVWTKGTDRSLVRITDPAKEAGTATLKMGDNIWNYLPNVDRTIKVPAAMMGGAWMGSHFTNDDLVKENRLAEEFTAALTAEAATSADHLTVIELVPKPTAAVVWGKVVVRLTQDEMPSDIRYFDEKGKLARTLSFGDVRDFGGHKVPATLQVVPADKPGEFTKVTYESLVIGADVPEDTFSLQTLKR